MTQQRPILNPIGRAMVRHEQSDRDPAATRPAPNASTSPKPTTAAASRSSPTPPAASAAIGTSRFAHLATADASNLRRALATILSGRPSMTVDPDDDVQQQIVTLDKRLSVVEDSIDKIDRRVSALEADDQPASPAADPASARADRARVAAAKASAAATIATGRKFGLIR